MCYAHDAAFGNDVCLRAHKVQIASDAHSEVTDTIHELGHFVSAWSNEKYQDVSSAIFNWYIDKFGYADYADAIDHFKTREGLNYSDAVEEFTNECIAGLFYKEGGAEDFVEWLQDESGYTKAEQKTILQKLIDLINDIIDSIKTVIRTGKLSATAQKAVQMEMDKAQDIRKMFLEAIDEASKNTNKKTATKDGVKYSLRAEFAQEYDRWDKKNPLIKFNVGRTSEVLKSLGVKDSVITWDSSKIIKIKAKHAEMTDSIIKQVPNIIESPIIVMDSKTKNSRLTLMGEVYAKGKPVLAVLELNPTSHKGVELDELKIASAYGKDNAQRLIDNSNVRYIDNNKKRIEKWEKRTGLQLPVGDSYFDSTNSISKNSENVNIKNKKYSLKDDEYLKLAEKPEENKARLQQMVDKAAKKKGYTIRAYHGTSRGDRVGNVFLPERSTSGPMAFFTSDKDIAHGYSRGKQDTSIAYDPDYDRYETQFRIKTKYQDMPLHRAWGFLDRAAQKRIEEKAGHIREDWDGDGELIVDSETNEANGGFQWQLKEARGNVITALEEQWLNSGYLFNEESKFLDVLEMSGVTEEFRKRGMDTIYFKDPNARHEKVYETYLKFNNPFNTDNVTEDFVNGLLDWYSEQDQSNYERESVEADLWDKNSIDAEVFAERLLDDIKNNQSHAWTSIPDSVTDYLKSLGHDGIVDKGGKYSGDTHTVYIPFSSEQIKSADPVTYDNDGNVIPLSERFNEDEVDIRYSIKSDKPYNDYSKALTSDEWKKYNNAMITGVDAGLRINDHSMLVECEKGDYSYKLVIYDNTFEEKPIKSVYGIGNDSYSETTIHEVAKYITGMEDNGYGRSYVTKTLKDYAKSTKISFGVYSGQYSRFAKYKGQQSVRESNNASRANTQKQSNGGTVPQGTEKNGSYSRKDITDVDVSSIVDTSSPRYILSEALKGTTLNAAERENIEKYQQNAQELDRQETAFQIIQKPGLTVFTASRVYF